MVEFSDSTKISIVYTTTKDFPKEILHNIFATTVTIYTHTHIYIYIFIYVADV